MGAQSEAFELKKKGNAVSLPQTSLESVETLVHFCDNSNLPLSHSNPAAIRRRSLSAFSALPVQRRTPRQTPKSLRLWSLPVSLQDFANFLHTRLFVAIRGRPTVLSKQLLDLGHMLLRKISVPGSVEISRRHGKDRELLEAALHLIDQLPQTVVLECCLRVLMIVREDTSHLAIPRIQQNVSISGFDSLCEHRNMLWLVEPFRLGGNPVHAVVVLRWAELPILSR